MSFISSTCIVCACVHALILSFCDTYRSGGVYCLNSCLAALQVALDLVVAQRRESGGRLFGIKLSALSIGLQRVAKMARKKKGKKSIFSILEYAPPMVLTLYLACLIVHTASVHLPRIGHSTPNFNWYGTERLIMQEVPHFQGNPHFHVSTLKVT